uniref:Uncharacterized protein n=1 Tax=Avena sativa TaxID=4498 RepID=A0ACD5Z1C4_AVESA
MDNCEVQVRQGRYRIAYYQAMKPESGCKLKKPNAYSDDEIGDQDYFKHLQDDESFEWFFHNDDSWIPGLNDYQRIVLRNFMPGSVEPEYPDVDGYRELYHTYEMDAVYVKYYGEISKKIKWIEFFLHMDARSAEWRDMNTRAWRQALRIATQLPHMTVRLAAFAYDEYIHELRDDASLKDLDLLYFEIWRLVAKDNRDYKDAVKEVHERDNFHMHKRKMMTELEGAPVFLTMRQRASCSINLELFCKFIAISCEFSYGVEHATCCQCLISSVYCSRFMTLSRRVTFLQILKMIKLGICSGRELLVSRQRT